MIRSFPMAGRRRRFNGMMAVGLLLLILAGLSSWSGQPKFSYYVRWGQGLDVTVPLALAALGILCLGIGLLFFALDLVPP